MGCSQQGFTGVFPFRYIASPKRIGSLSPHPAPIWPQGLDGQQHQDFLVIDLSSGMISTGG
jgi:hypothetical protein